jgi:exonuclease SbcD
MKILHTSDWHLGHTLRDVGREFEHQAFIDWLIGQIEAHEVDALLIAGDVFDTSNPSAASQEMWYGFLARAVRARPGLQIVAIAGNHDSAARLEAPDHLLRQFRIRVVGSLPRDGEGNFAPAGLLVPLEDGAGIPAALVVAMPFLRAGDLPEVEAEDSLIGGVQQLYGQALDAARAHGLPSIAMGHCYLVDGKMSEGSERKVLGGNLHALPLSLFPEDVCYVALGHLHLPQALDGERVRYSGSPIPLSLGERHYRHSVTLVELMADGSLRQELLPIPRTVKLLRLPEQGFLDREQLLMAILELEPAPERQPGQPRPFVEAGVRLETFEPGLAGEIQEALDVKGYFMASLTLQYTGNGRALAGAGAGQSLNELTVEDIFRKKWNKDFQQDPTEDHLAALHELIDQVGQELAP